MAEFRILSLEVIMGHSSVTTNRVLGNLDILEMKRRVYEREKRRKSIV
jgi:hypothetical protein